MSLIRVLTLLLCVLPLWAGQSLVMSGTSSATWTDPNRANTLDYRVEFQLDTLAAHTSYSQILYVDGVGFRLEWLADGRLQVSSARDSFDTPCQISLTGRTNILFRAQRDYANLQFHCEIWNVDGSGYSATSMTITPGAWGLSGGTINETNVTANFGFLRAFSTIVALASTPPVTAVDGDIFSFKFDGDGADSSGNGRNLSSVAGFTFADTPDQIAFSKPVTPSTPNWLSFLPLRAGHPSALASNSYSMVDSSSTVTCFWQQIPAATGEALTSQVTFDDRTSCTPTLTGLVFGAYQFRLQVTDADGNTSTADFPVGAVAYDDNNVVIYPDTRLYELLGPQTVLGAGPWEYVDRRHWSLSREIAGYLVINGGTWQNHAAKTDINGLAITGTVYWSATTYPRSIYGVGTNFLDVFCGGQAGDAPDDSNFVPWIVTRGTDSNWGGSGGIERQVAHRVTACVSDTEITVISPGVTETGDDAVADSPGVPWGVYFHNWYPNDQAGTVYIANGATTLNGTGTSLQTFYCSGGSSVTNAAPTIFIYDGSVYVPKTVNGCTSETQVSISVAWAGTTISAPGNHYVPIGGYPDLGQWNDNAQNHSFYYDVPAAHYRMWYRSGDIKARDAARYELRNLLIQPYFGAVNNPRSWPVTSPFVAAVVDTDAWQGKDFWPSMVDRLNYRIGNSYWSDARFWEQRDYSYFMALVAQTARWHPTEATRNTFNDLLISQYTNQAVAYQGTLGNYYSPIGDSRNDGRVWEVANGSTTATLFSGSSISSDYCGSPVMAAGSISIAGDGVTVTGTGTDFTGTGTGHYVLMRGTLNGDPYISTSLIASSPTPTSTTMTLVHPWRGDANPSRYEIYYRGDYNSSNDTYAFTQGYPLIVWEHVNSGGTAYSPRVIDFDEQYWCTYVDGTHISLDHAYTGSTATTAYRKAASGAPAGLGLWSTFYSQPFMDGLRMTTDYKAYKALETYDPTTAAGYLSKMGDLASYLFSIQQTDTKGLPYFSAIPICRPYTASGSVCDTDPTVARDYWMEGIGPLGRLYLTNPNAPDLARNDQLYADLYSKTGTTAPIAGDGTYVQYLENAGSNARGKAFGQGFGQGGGSTWEAIREGGQATPVTRTLKYGVNLASVSGATQAEVQCLSPAGELVAATGSASPVSLSPTGFEAGAARCRHRYLDVGDSPLTGWSDYSPVN